MAKNATTPTKTHSQKLFGLFPDWRLKNAVKNASLEALEDSEEACEWWGWRGAMLLMIGLIAEVILAIWDPPHGSIPGRWGNVLGTSLVALGVGLEVQFHRMASRRAGERALRAKLTLAATIDEVARLQIGAAQANERTAKAELELAQLKAIRRLNHGTFAESLKGVPKPPFAVEILYVDASDCMWLAADIWSALIDAGWATSSPMPVRGPNSLFPVGSHLVPWTMTYGGQSMGVSVVVRANPDLDKPLLGGMVKALADALPNRQAYGGQDPSMPEEALRVFVAPR